MTKKLLILGLLVIFLGLFRTLLLNLEKDLLFQPEREWLDGFSRELKNLNLQELFINTASGTNINALYQNKESDEVFLFCHGNAGNMSYNLENIRNLEATGRSYLLFDYPGYGKSDGKISEATLFDSGQAAYEFLTKKKNIDPQRIILSGQSLGAAVCSTIAAENEVRSVILESGFISPQEVAKDMIGGFLSPFVSNLFRNDLTVPKITEPILFIHGESDNTIDKRHSEHLYSLANEPKYIEILEGLDHNEFVMDDEESLSKRLENFYNTSLFPPK